MVGEETVSSGELRRIVGPRLDSGPEQMRRLSQVPENNSRNTRICEERGYA